MLSKKNLRTTKIDKESDVPRADRYYSVEFALDELLPLYQFKLRNSESMSMFVLVKEDSEILNRLEVGRVIKMKYYNSDISYPPEYKTTQIDNIINDKDGRFSGHCMVGLSILPTIQGHQYN